MEPREEDIEFLEHYGVKGMKWGVRKARRKEKKAGKRDARNEKRAAKGKAPLRRRTTGKQVAAVLLAGPPGLVAYNSISARYDD